VPKSKTIQVGWVRLGFQWRNRIDMPNPAKLYRFCPLLITRKTFRQHFHVQQSKKYFYRQTSGDGRVVWGGGNFLFAGRFCGADEQEKIITTSTSCVRRSSSGPEWSRIRLDAGTGLKARNVTAVVHSYIYIRMFHIYIG